MTVHYNNDPGSFMLQAMPKKLSINNWKSQTQNNKSFNRQNSLASDKSLNISFKTGELKSPKSAAYKKHTSINSA